MGPTKPSIADRPRSLFYGKFSNFFNEGGIKGEILHVLYDYYNDKIDIMGRDGTYGASTMATCCIDAAATFGNVPTTLEEKAILYTLVEELYNIKKSNGTEIHTHAPVDQKSEAYKQNRKVALELQRQMDQQYQDEVLKEGGGEVDAVFGGEIIELIHDWKLSQDANSEGMRAIGLLPADFNSDTDEVPTGLAVYTPKYAHIIHTDDPDDLGIRCPDCFKGDGLIMLGGMKYTCIYCDNKFVTDSRLEDFIDYEQDQDKEGNDLVDEEGNPLMKPMGRKLSKTEQRIKELYPDAGFKRIETDVESIEEFEDDDDDED